MEVLKNCVLKSSNKDLSLLCLQSAPPADTRKTDTLRLLPSVDNVDAKVESLWVDLFPLLV